MAYTDIDKSDDYFTTFLWTGDGTSPKSFTGVGFQADMMWSKIRTDTHQHNIVDTVRGVNQRLISTNLTNAEDTTCTHGHFDSLDSDGFTITGAGGYWNVNTNAENYVGWLWKAGGTGVSNTQGSIASTVSANTTAGFSVVSYTGNNTAGATVGHGLGQKPACIIVKRRSAAMNWGVYHQSLASDEILQLDVTNAVYTGSGVFNATQPTALVFYLGGGTAIDNASGSTYIAYCFAEKKGFSKFGSYIGNGSTDGTFVYTGFKPAWVMIKRTNSTTPWCMWDNKRNTFNVTQNYLYANGSDAEGSGAGLDIDMLSNGFKLKSTSSFLNTSGDSFIYMVFAESPFTTSTGIPATAR
jgi:hypothetical protein